MKEHDCEFCDKDSRDALKNYGRSDLTCAVPKKSKSPGGAFGTSTKKAPGMSKSFGSGFMHPLTGNGLAEGENEQ